MKTNEFSVTIDKFYQGFSPSAHVNSLSEMKNMGHASAMVNCDISVPEYVTQAPALANLTNGAVSELINFIMDKAVSSDVTFGIGATKLWKISSTTVASGGTPSWPRTITNCVDGESCIDFGGNLYYFYNTASAGDIGIYDLNATFDDDWGSTVPVGKAALQKAPHPVACKENIMAFGNGRYLGIYFNGSTFNASKLDFGINNEVADVVFHAGQWWIAVNGGVSGTNRNLGQIFLYDGAAISGILADETGVGLQRIGFLYVVNGIIWVAYQDLSSAGGYKIGYISGRQLKPLKHFTGSLPTFAQKTLYKDTILFISNALIYSCGSTIEEELPFQISQLADAGYGTVGALACPFGEVLVASSDGGSNHRLAKFSGYDVLCSWKSIILKTTNPKMVGYIDRIEVLTNNLGSGARADLTIEKNQATSISSVFQITTAGKRKHISKPSISNIEDFRVALSWANGSAANDCRIRQITIEGHFYERAF